MVNKKRQPPPDLVCKMQGGEKVSQVWCDFAQYEVACFGCSRNLGRERSRYQEAVKTSKVVGK